MKNLFTLKGLLIALLFISASGLYAQTFSDWTSTNKSHGTTSQNSYTLNVVNGSVLTFDWAVSSENNYDWLIVTLNGSEILKRSGSQSGSYTNTFTTAGTQTLVVKYTKDGSQSSGNDQGRIYNIKLTSPIVNSGSCGENATWELRDNTLFIKGTGSMTDYAYSSNTPWYDNNSSINQVVINDGITSIGSCAFSNCNNLKSVTLPGSLESIGYSAFYYCYALENITLPSSVSIIDNSAFYGCSKLNTVYNNSALKLTAGSEEYGYVAYYANAIIKENDDVQGDYIFRTTDDGEHLLVAYTGNDSIVSLPISYGGGKYAIDTRVFRKCKNIKSITIPSNVTAVGKNAFEGCDNLKETHISDLVAWCNIDFENNYSTPVYYSKQLHLNGEVMTNVVFPASLKEIKDYTFYNNQSLSSVTLHDDIISIGSYAFYSCYYINFGDIVIPSKVTNIGSYAFFRCNITSISIPEGVTNIGDYAFYHCDDLSGELIIPGSVKKIGRSAFGDCTKISSVKILNGVEIIGDGAFDHCRFSSIIIPASVKEIGDFAFFDTSIQNVVFEDGESTLLLGNQKYSDGIGGGLFEHVPVKTVYIGRNLTFSRANDSYNKPRSNALFAHWYANSYSSLQTAIIGPKVTSLPKYLFEDCKELKTVISCIPADELCAFDKIAEGFLPSEATLYVPVNAKEVYSGTADWKDFGTINEFVAENGLLFDITSKEDATVEVLNYIGNENSVTIPAEVEILGEKYSVTSIRENAFYNCTHLENITIPNSVVSIGYDAFFNTSWYNNQPDGVVYAGKVLYKYKGAMANDTFITIKEGTLGIADNAFSNYNGLTGVAIPNSVTCIGRSAFYNCTNLSAVHINDLSAWCKINFGGSYSNPLQYAENFYLNGSMVTDLVIPSDVTEIKSYAFYGFYGLTSVTIPYSVTSIGDYAFCGCRGITNITIPNSVTSIGDYAFSSCRGLTGVAIPNSVTRIGDYAFNYCNNLTNVTFGNNVTSIGNCAFYNCSNLSCALSLPASLTDIGEQAFYNCSGLTGDISIPDGVKNIGVSTFYNCSSLTGVVIGNGVETIGASAFNGCSSIVRITVPASVKSIGNDVFKSCTALKDVRIEDGAETLSLGYYYYSSYTRYGLFYDCPLETLYLGRNLSYDSNYYYSSPFYKRTNLNTVTIGEKVTSISDYAFNDCDGLTSVTIPNSVTSIGNDAFDGCSGLTSVTIPYSVTSIGESAFRACSGLTSIEIPNSVTSIGDYAFSSCRGLTNITIGNSVTSIGDEAFYYCSCLTNITIGNSVTSIGDEAFYGCSELKIIYNFSSLNVSKGSANHGYVAYYADEVINVPGGGLVGNFVFKMTNGAAVLNAYLGDADVILLPADYNGLSYSIGENVFKNNTEITRVVIPGAVTSIGNNAFYGCTNLSTVTNLSSLDISERSTDHGYVAYYAYDVDEYTNRDVMGNFIFETINAGYYSEKYQLVEYIEETDVIEKFDDITCVNNDDYYAHYSSYVTVKAGDILSLKWASEYYYDMYGNYNYSSLTIRILNDYSWEDITSDNITTDYSYAFLEEGTYRIEFYNYGPGKIYDFKISEPLEVVLPSDYKGKKYAIADYAFEETKINSVTISDGVTGIGDYAFSCCRDLRDVTIGNSVTSIGDYAFSSCYDLRDITMGNSVTGIGWNVFSNCDNLTSVYINDLSAWCKINFGGSNSNPLYYAENFYLNGSMVTDLVIPSDVTEIKFCAFCDFDGFRSVTIPNSITSIGYAAFTRCSGLTSIEIPNSVTSIDDYAFSDCYNLTDIYFESNPAIGSNAIPSNVACHLAINDSDAVNFNVENANTFSDVSYARALQTGCYGTIMLPFVPDAESLENYAFYALKEAGRGYVRFEEVDELAANTPYLYTLREGKENVVITGGETTISSIIETPSIAGWETVGSFTNETVDCNDGNYYEYSVARNDIEYITDTLTMAPFRAYFKSYDVYNSNLSIIIGVTTGITELSPDDIDGFDSGEIFDLNGRRVSKTVKGGIYIINGKKVIL